MIPAGYSSGPVQRLDLRLRRVLRVLGLRRSGFKPPYLERPGRQLHQQGLSETRDGRKFEQTIVWGELGRAQVSSPNGDRGRNASPPAGGRIRSYTFGPFAAE